MIEKLTPLFIQFILDLFKAFLRQKKKFNRTFKTLKNEIQLLSSLQKNPYRSCSSDVKLLNKIKKILIDLSDYSFIFYFLSKKQIDMSLGLLFEMENNPNAPQNFPPFVGVSLREIWKEDMIRLTI